MTEDGKVVFKVQGDDSDLGKSLDNATDTINRKTSSWGGIAAGAGKAIGSAFLGMAAAGASALVSIGKNGIELASNLSEVQNVVDTVFGDSAGKIDAWSKSALDAFGLSELAAKKYTSTMGAMLDSMGLSDATVADMSTSLSGLAGDMASFYNLDSQDAFDKLRAGIAGETEPLKQLGINMSVVNLEAFALSQGITKSYNDMSQAEQATLRYNYIMNATANAQGDFAKTSGSLANQQRLLSEKFNSLSAEMGKILIPITQTLMTTFTGLMDTNGALFTSLQTVFTSIASAATEILPQLITAFTELLPPILQLVVDLLPLIVSLFTEIVPILISLAQELFPPLVEIIKALLPPIAELIGALLPPLAMLLETLAPLLTMIAKLLSPIIELFSSILGPVVEFISAALEPLISIISEIVDAVFPALQDALGGLGDVFGTIFAGITDVVGGALDGVKEMMGGIIDFITGVFTGNWSKAWEGVKSIFSGIFNSLVAIFKTPINWIVDGMNFFIRGLNTIKVPDWVPLIGGKGINIAEIPRLAKGGTITDAGSVMVGERGPEILSLPESATVTPLSKYNSMLGTSATPLTAGARIDTSGIDDAVEASLSKWGVYLDGRKVGRFTTAGVSEQQANNFNALKRSGYDGIV